MDPGLEDVPLSELLRMAIDDRLLGLHVAFPAKVTAYDATKQTVECVPQLNRSVPDGDGNFVSFPLPKLADVPLCFPRSSEFFITFPIEVGSFVFVICADRNIGKWREVGAQSDPGDLGTHTLDGAVAIPVGPFPTAGKLAGVSTTHLVIGKAGGTPAAAARVGDTVEVTIPALSVTGSDPALDLVVEGVITSGSGHVKVT